MIDIENLEQAILAKINATSSLTSVQGKCYVGGALTMQPPHVQINVTVSGSPTKAFGGFQIDYVTASFKAFAKKLSDANAIVTALGSAFDDGTKLSLTGQQHLRTERKGGATKMEGKNADSLRYSSSLDIEFMVQS